MKLSSIDCNQVYMCVCVYIYILRNINLAYHRSFSMLSDKYAFYIHYTSSLKT
jgi:hypothetical protein